MNEQITKELLDIIRDTRGFVLEQAPEVFQQALRYGFWSNMFQLCFSLAVIVLACVVYKKTRPTKDKANDYYYGSGSDRSIGGIIGTCSLLAVGLMTLGCEVTELIQIQLAPKVYLLHYFKPGKSCS